LVALRGFPLCCGSLLLLSFMHVKKIVILSRAQRWRG
jgi:hypothetical protein